MAIKAYRKLIFAACIHNLVLSIARKLDVQEAFGWNCCCWTVKVGGAWITGHDAPPVQRSAPLCSTYFLEPLCFFSVGGHVLWSSVHTASSRLEHLPGSHCIAVHNGALYCDRWTAPIVHTYRGDENVFEVKNAAPRVWKNITTLLLARLSFVLFLKRVFNIYWWTSPTAIRFTFLESFEASIFESFFFFYTTDKIHENVAHGNTRCWKEYKTHWRE